MMKTIKFYSGIVVFICFFIGLGGATYLAFSELLGKNSSQNSIKATSQSGIAVSNTSNTVIRQDSVRISNNIQRHSCANKECQTENNVRIKKQTKQKKGNTTILQKVEVLVSRVTSISF